MGYHFTTEEIADPFQAQFRNAPRFWREFVAAYLFAQGVEPGEGPEGIKVRDFGPEGQEVYRPARWFSRDLRDRIIWGLQRAECALTGWPMADDPRVWEVLGHMEAGAGVGVDDLDYSRAERAIVKSASDLIGVGQDVQCWRGVIS